MEQSSQYVDKNPDRARDACVRKTPLYDVHVAQGGRMVDYAGWLLPLQFRGLLAEHQAVRTSAGLFDVSHMGEILLTGADALTFADRVLTARVDTLQPGQIAYSPMCAADGGTLDDVLVYHLAPGSVLLVVNAANRANDVAWLQSLSGADAPRETRGLEVQVQDLSEQWGLIALQGPDAAALLDTLVRADTRATLHALAYYRFARDLPVADVPCLVSRTGYTGEDGYEIMVPVADVVAVWNALLAARAAAADGTVIRAVPCGLGCRDTLRFEAGMPLYGNELARDITPLEAGLARFVALDKPHFIGRQALVAQQERGVPRKLIGFELLARGIARYGYSVYAHDANDPVGIVTTGYQAPTLGLSVGTALLRADVAQPEQAGLTVEIRGKRLPIAVRSRFFYKRERKET